MRTGIVGCPSSGSGAAVRAAAAAVASAVPLARADEAEDDEAMGGDGEVTSVAAAAGVVREPMAGVAVRPAFSRVCDAGFAASAGRSDLRTIL